MDERDDHYTDANTTNGVHSCLDSACMTRGVPEADLNQIGYALSKLLPYLDDTPVKATVFRDASGLYVLLTVDYGDSRAVLGAIYTPTLLETLRSSGHTLTWAGPKAASIE